MTNRVMRVNDNPNGRGYIVRVLEEVSRNDLTGFIEFKIIASETAGTRKKRDAVYTALKAEFNAR